MKVTEHILKCSWVLLRKQNGIRTTANEPKNFGLVSKKRNLKRMGDQAPWIIGITTSLFFGSAFCRRCIIKISRFY